MQFIFEYIDSVEQIDIIALLKTKSDIWVDSHEISKELRRHPTSVSNCLQLLHTRGFFEKDELNPSLYRYKGKTQEIDALIEELLNEYQIRAHAVLELIFSPMKKARTFADAFNLSKTKKPNGDNNG